MTPSTTVSPAIRRRKLITRSIIGIVVILIIGAIAAKTASRLHQPPPPPRTILTRKGNLGVTVSETGTVSPDNQIDVKSKVAGRLLTLPIVEGQYVRKGQLIATVDTSQIDPQIASTQAQLDQAEARLLQSEASYNLQVAQTNNAIDQAQAGLSTSMAHLATVKAGSRPLEIDQQNQTIARAKIELQDALRTQKRKQGLLAKGFISQSEADTANVAVDTATSNLESAQEQLGLMQVGPRQEDIHEAQMQVNTAKLELDSAKVNVLQNDIRKSDIAQAQSSVDQIRNQLQQLMVQLSDTRILAPSSGIVLKKYRAVNEIVQSATTGFSDADSMVATLGTQPMVRVDINEIDIPKVNVGDPVLVTVDSLPGESFKAKVATIAPVSTNFSTSQTQATTSSVSKFPVTVHFLKPDQRLRPGMNVTVTIITAEHDNVVIAPLEAVSLDSSGNSGSVTILEPTNKQTKQAVTLGLRNDIDVEIVKGLSPNEKLIPKPINVTDRHKTDISGGGGGGN